MSYQYLAHPGEELLEGYLLGRIHQAKRENIDDHVIACETCIGRLEALEIELAILQSTLINFDSKRASLNLCETIQASWRSACRFGRRSWKVGMASAMLAICITSTHEYSTPSYSLAADRGTDRTSLLRTGWSFGPPENAILHGHRAKLSLDTTDLPQEALRATLVTSLGMRVWKGSTTVSGEQAVISLAPVKLPGTYLLRLETETSNELLREYLLEVK